MTDKAEFSMELEEFLKVHSILASEGCIDNRQLEKTIETLRKGTEENSRDVSLILNSNLNSFLHICHMLNQSPFLRQDGDEVFVKSLKLTRNLREKLRNVLDRDIEAKHEYLVAKQHEEALRFADCLVMESQRSRRILKARNSKKTLDIIDAMTVKSIIDRFVDSMGYLRSLTKDTGIQAVYDEIEFSKFISDEETFMRETMHNLLKKVCFEESDFSSESSLDKLELMIRSNCKLGLESKMQEYFDNFLDLSEFSHGLEAFEDSAMNFVRTKREESSLISKAIGGFVESVVQDEEKRELRFGMWTTKIFMLSLMKAVLELCPKNQQWPEDAETLRLEKNRSFFHKILSFNNQLNSSNNNGKSTENQVDDVEHNNQKFAKMFYELQSSSLYSLLKQHYWILDETYFLVRVSELVLGFDSNFQKLDKIIKEDKKDTSLTSALKKFESANKRTFEASIIGSFATLSSSEFQKESMGAKIIGLMMRMLSQCDGFLKELIKRTTLEEFIVTLEYVVFVKEKLISVIRECCQKNITLASSLRTIESIEASLRNSDRLTGIEFLSRYQSFEVSNKTIKHIEAIKLHQTAQKLVLNAQK